MLQFEKIPERRVKVKKPQIRYAAALAAGAGLALGLIPATAGASSQTQVLHLAGYQQTFTYTTAAGKLLAQPSENSGIGDVIQFTDRDYSGTTKHHSKSLLATDHGVCVFTSTTVAPTCYIQVAMGSSMILAQGAGGPSNTTDFTVVGGTGSYQGVSGTAVATNTDESGSTSNIVVTLHRS